jgi:hypothetical protein
MRKKILNKSKTGDNEYFILYQVKDETFGMLGYGKTAGEVVELLKTDEPTFRLMDVRLLTEGQIISVKAVTE